MTDTFAKYDEIMSLSPGAIIETIDTIEVCHSPDENGWKRLDVNAGVDMRVTSVCSDSLIAVIPLVGGFRTVTIFPTQWKRLEPIGKTSDAGEM